MDLRRVTDLKGEERRGLVNRRALVEEVLPQVRVIVEAVRRGGDSAVVHYTEALDGVRLKGLRAPRRRMTDAWRRTPTGLQRALRRAARNIEAFHREQMPRSYELPLEGDPSLGFVGLRYVPFRRVGVYVPGGSRGYPSTLLMACIPARLAGVSEVAVASPPSKTGLPHELVLAAADLAGVEEVYACGGAQAIAALALGTESVGRVEKLFGPGNRYVTAAKLLLRDEVAIDTPSGPSEIVVVADAAADAAAVASDLKSQAEHGPDSMALLITTSEALAHHVARLLTDVKIGGPSPRWGPDPRLPILLAEDLEEAIALANEVAPEHLVLNVAEPRSALGGVVHAGCVFLGPWTPVTLGDYCLGTNHSLPTMGAARWQGPLGLGDFLRPMAYAEAQPRGLASLGPTARILAEAEGFPAHAAAITARRGGGP